MKKLPLVKNLEAWLDDADFERFHHLKWTVNGAGQVSRDGELLVGRTGIVYLDRLIVGATSQERVEHQNRIEFDCRRENLEKVAGKPGKNGDDRDTDLGVLRFREAFPNQRRFLARDTRKHLNEVRETLGMTPLEFLARIEAWAAARSNIAPWDLEKPAPILQTFDLPEVPVPTAGLPEASAQQLAWVRSMQTPWTDEEAA
jgi:hypothetical protein